MNLDEAFSRGWEDPELFSEYFCGRKLHSGQAEWMVNAAATTNILMTGNRWGKTSVLTVGHIWSCVYKLGGEEAYLDANGDIDFEAWANLRYQTAHTANLAETCQIVWHDARKIIKENRALRSLIAEQPKSLPPHIEFINGSRWLFRTLGDDSSGLDGKSFYLITVDEAGWLQKLREMMDNVLRIRVSDVSGRIWLAGTVKPGEVSLDFFKYAIRAAAHTGRNVSFEHRSIAPRDGVTRKYNVDESLYLYAEEFGVDLDVFLDAATEAAA